jgi:hypothetical protein
MAMMTNAQNTYGAIGIREDLTDIVALIDPQDTQSTNGKSRN